MRMTEGPAADGIERGGDGSPRSSEGAGRPAGETSGRPNADPEPPEGAAGQRQAHGPRTNDGHDHGASGHDHSHVPEIRAENERAVLIAVILTAGFMLAELAAGLLSGSLALIADAGHMLTDAAALALAWAGFRFGRRSRDDRRTFGYLRFEILAGFVNAITLIALVLWITVEAIDRLLDPAPVLAGPMLVVALLGLGVNIAVFLILRRADTSHVNIRGAMLHVLGDLLGSVAAILAAAVIYVTGWTPIDPILSVLLSAIILRSAWALLKASLHILMQGTPDTIVLSALSRALLDGVEGLRAVQHVHVWSITSGHPVATMEVQFAPGTDPARGVAAVKEVLDREFGIRHATVEIDWSAGASHCAVAPGTTGAECPPCPDPDGAGPQQSG